MTTRDELAFQVEQLRSEVRDLDRLARNHGTQHLPYTGMDPTRARWRAFTPLLESTGTDPTMGTGAGQEGRWIRVGNLVVYTFNITFGTGGGGGTGTYQLVTPVPWHGFYSNTIWNLGTVTMQDVSTGDLWTGIVRIGTASNYLTIMTTSGTTGSSANMTPTFPFTWAVSDRFGGTVTYMAAR